MPAQTTLMADELRLRALQRTDAAAIQELCGDARIADTAANIPHPYPDGAAYSWLVDVAEKTHSGEHLAYAITLAESDELVGVISLMNIASGDAELGYWVGVPWWGRGIASAAVATLVAHAFAELGIQRIQALVLSRNPASSKVLLRAGFGHTGNMPTVCGRNARAEPTDYYALMRKQC